MEDENQIEYDIAIRISARSTLDAEKLKQMLVVALWDESTDSMTPDGAGSELQVIEYQRVTVEVADE